MNKDGYSEVSNAYITGLINKLDAERVKVERLRAKLTERDGVIEMILLRELRLREALEGMLSAYDDDRLFGDDPIEVSIARAALAGKEDKK